MEHGSRIFWTRKLEIKHLKKNIIKTSNRKSSIGVGQIAFYSGDTFKEWEVN